MMRRSSSSAAGRPPTTPLSRQRRPTNAEAERNARAVKAFEQVPAVHAKRQRGAGRPALPLGSGSGALADTCPEPCPELSTTDPAEAILDTRTACKYAYSQVEAGAFQ